MKKVAVIIVNFNSFLDTIEAVSSVEESLLPKGFERKIWVIENGSKEPEAEILGLENLKKFPDVTILPSEKNLGFTGGNNLGMEKAREWGADFFLLLNTDTKVDKRFLVELISAAQDDQQIGLLSPKIYFYPQYEFHKERYSKKDLGKVIWYAGGVIDWKNIVGKGHGVDEVDHQGAGNKGEGTVMDTDFATGCCMLIRREVVEKIGMLDQKLFFSWEDTDFSVRAKRAGFRVVYVPSSVIWHKNANTSGGAGSDIQDFFQTRNRLIFAFKYASLKVKILLFLTLLTNRPSVNRLKAIFSAVV